MAQPDAAVIKSRTQEATSMLQKTALLVASLAASLTLAFALAAAGFAPGSTTAPVDATSTVGIDATNADATPSVQVDKVYVPAPAPQQTITVHKVVKTAGGEAGEHEGSEGDD